MVLVTVTVWPVQVLDSALELALGQVLVQERDQALARGLVPGPALVQARDRAQVPGPVRVLALARVPDLGLVAHPEQTRLELRRRGQAQQ